MHLAIGELLLRKYDFSHPERLRFGLLLPDCITDGGETHFICVSDDGKKQVDFRAFYNEYESEIKSDEIYLGYFLHLVQDAVFRRFMYEKHGWDPRPDGNLARLYNDYGMLNSYLIEKYSIKDIIAAPPDLTKTRIYGDFIFDVVAFLAELHGDFSPYIHLMQRPKPFPKKYTFEYISEKFKAWKIESNSIQDFRKKSRIPENLFILLQIFSDRKGTSLSIAELQKFYSEQKAEISENSLKVLISNLRSYFKKFPEYRFAIVKTASGYEFQILE